ncbi:MAG: selenium metabolism-associated LysR family transcriptional regulator [Candidatus Bathyarchaeia archaeon]
MKIQYLSTFITVLTTGSFSAAAKELVTSQATVSNHIAALEKDLGTKVFIRTTKGVELTEAGKILQETTKKIFEEIEKAKMIIASTEKGLQGEIKIAASTIPGEHILPSLISEFRREYPAVKFKITVTDSINSLQSLTDNEVHFAAVGSLEGFEGIIEFIQIGEEELVLIVPPNHELAKKKVVQPQDLRNYPFVYREDKSGTRQETRKMFSDQRISVSDLDVVLEFGSTESVITAVSEGTGISIVSSIAARKAEAAGIVKTIRLEGAKNMRKFYVTRLQKKELPKAMENFWVFCRHFKFKHKTSKFQD